MRLEAKESIFMNNLKHLKLIALMLVVLGHATDIYKGGWVFTSTYQSNFYKWTSIYVNSIHMQIFLFISGSVYAYCRIRKQYHRSYLELIRNKLKRLIVPYIFIGALFMIPIEMKAGVGTYDLGYIYSLKNLILGYESGHLWFLMMLFTLFCIYYLLEKVVNKVDFRVCIMFLFSIQMLYSRLPRIFLINKAIYYIFFFYLGYLMYLKLENMIKIEAIICKYNIITIIGIIIIIPTCITLRDNLPQVKIITSIIYNLINDLIALLGIVQMYTVVLFTNNLKSNNSIEKYLDYINKYNFNIYLLHEPIMFIILVNVLNLNPSIVVISCFLGSVVISIIIAKIYYLVKIRLKDLVINKGKLKESIR